MKTKRELKIKLFNHYIMVEYKENLFYLKKEILQDKLMAI